MMKSGLVVAELMPETMPFNARISRRWLAGLGSTLALTACQSIGPPTVPRDRLDYGSAISESWKYQTLVNIVKLRYNDPPLFVDVRQIISAYALETSVSLGSIAGDVRSNSLGGTGRFTDRPTVTYVPLTGNRFVAGLITPVAPASMFSAIQAGWRADILLPIGIGAINGISNEDYSAGLYRPADPRFRRVVELISNLQRDGELSFRVEQRPDGSATLMVVRPSTAFATETAELQRLLGLEPGTTEFHIVFSDRARDGTEIAIRTRSLLNVMQLLSARAAVPAADVESGRAHPGADSGDGVRGFRILSSENEPVDAFVASRYHDTWFYIDDRDLASKGVFSLMMLLFSMSEAAPDDQGALITIPAQ